MPSFPTTLKNLFTSAQTKAAREVYEDLRTFHGTTEAGKRDIRANGFALSRKATGATLTHLGEEAAAQQQFARFRENARSHHYVATRRDIAFNFAELVAHGTRTGRPVVVRVIGTKEELGLQVDPDSSGDEALRTRRDIPVANVLRAKGEANPEGARVFQPHLEARLGKPVSAQEAERLLKRVQSESGDES